jgi:hypothetical protein
MFGDETDRQIEARIMIIRLWLIGQLQSEH